MYMTILHNLLHVGELRKYSYFVIDFHENSLALNSTLSICMRHNMTYVPTYLVKSTFLCSVVLTHTTFMSCQNHESWTQLFFDNVAHCLSAWLEATQFFYGNIMLSLEWNDKVHDYSMTINWVRSSWMPAINFSVPGEQHLLTKLSEKPGNLWAAVKGLSSRGW